MARRLIPTPSNEDALYCRESSVPNCLTPYYGKYEVPETLPDGLHVHKIMAGQADRGAAACVLECTTSGLHEGRCFPFSASTCHHYRACACCAACSFLPSSAGKLSTHTQRFWLPSVAAWSNPLICMHRIAGSIAMRSGKSSQSSVKVLAAVGVTMWTLMLLFSPIFSRTRWTLMAASQNT